MAMDNGSTEHPLFPGVPARKTGLRTEQSVSPDSSTGLELVLWPGTLADVLSGCYTVSAKALALSTRASSIAYHRM